LDPVQAVKHICYVLHGNAKRYIGQPCRLFGYYAMLATGLTAVGSGWLVYNEGWLINQSAPLQLTYQ